MSYRKNYQHIMDSAAYRWAVRDDSMDFLYDFLDNDLESKLEEEREYIPEGMEDLLAANSLEDYVWLWLEDTGARGFLAYIHSGRDHEGKRFSDLEAGEAHGLCLHEWSIDNAPHVSWLIEDGFELPDWLEPQA